MRLRGKVVRGLGIGKKLGYPTANLEIYGSSASVATEAELPAIAPGVYAARAMYEDVTHDAAVVVGAREENGKPLVEVCFLDFDGDLSGKEIEVEFLEKVSEIEIFKDKRELKKKIKRDIKKVRLCLQE